MGKKNIKIINNKDDLSTTIIEHPKSDTKAVNSDKDIINSFPLKHFIDENTILNDNILLADKNVAKILTPKNKDVKDDKEDKDLKDAKNKNKTSNDFLKELLVNQLKTVNQSKKLNYNDIKRISKFLSTSIFDPISCSLWTGYITNEQNKSKGTYINFYFNQKKIALHRLLYLNFIGDILNSEYIKFSCDNKGKCCNIHHMNKYSYNSLTDNAVINNNNNKNSVFINCDKHHLTVEL